VNVNPNPTCVGHPAFDVNVTWRAGIGRTPPVWSCSVCHRILGLASHDHRSMGSHRIWPEGRRPPPSQMHWNKVQWEKLIE
jgi:hypothetical protein